MFLDDCVKARGGQQYHGQAAMDLSDSFDEELSLLRALCLRQISLKLIPAQGMLIEPLGVFDQTADGTYQLSDLACGAESWLTVRCTSAPLRSWANPVRLLLLHTPEAMVCR